MDFFAFYKDLTNKKLAPLNLLYGFERFLLDNSVKYIEQNFLNPVYKDMNINVMDGNLDVDTLLNWIQALPFFDERRLIILQNVNLFKNDIDPKLMSTFEDMPEGVHILFIEKDIDKRKKIYKFLDKNATIVNFEKLTHKEFSKWTSKKFKENHVEIDPHVLNYFIEMVNYLNPESPRNLYEVDHYIKSISYLKEPLTTAVIDRYVDIPIESNIFKMMDALSENKMQEVLFIFNSLVQSGEAEIKIFFMMSSQFRNIYKCKKLMAAGHTSASIASKLSIHPFVAKKASHFANGFTFEALEDIILIISQIDKDLKSTGVKPQLLIEKGILEIFMVKQNLKA